MNRLPRPRNHRNSRPDFNKHSSKHFSLYNQLLIFARITRDPVKFNSTNKSQITNDYNEKFTPRRIEFMHTPNNTNITVRRSFSMLEDIEKQDIFKLRDELLQTAKAKNRDNNTACEIRRSSIDSEYYTLVEDITDFKIMVKRFFF
ncbi:hypothetical protein DMUE_0615 [Dictyocoela muelleri]|nr:hypothetical protein DMUE_0615 [Dictyocoela muelleri]